MKPAEPLVLLSLTDSKRRPLDVALDRDCQPWPASREEEMAEFERQLAEERRLELLASGPRQCRKESEIVRLEMLLDEIGKDGNE